MTIVALMVLAASVFVLLATALGLQVARRRRLVARFLVDASALNVLVILVAWRGHDSSALVVSYLSGVCLVLLGFVATRRRS
jgi:hypothetical protein